MTAQTAIIESTTADIGRGGMFLGFGNSLRKEFTEWFRGPKAVIVAGVSVVSAIFMTLIPFIAEKTGEAEAAGLMSMDPTANVLLAYTDRFTLAFIVVLSTMSLLSSERDRGTLAWSLTNPVSPTAVILAKFVAAFLVLAVIAVAVPLLVSIGLATIVYGGPPDFAIVGPFAAMFLAVPLFYVALTVGLGSGIKSTVGVAGAAFAVMFVPQILGGLLPIVTELSPTSIGVWAMAVANGKEASSLTPIGWFVSMMVIVIGAKLVFDRQEV